MKKKLARAVNGTFIKTMQPGHADPNEMMQAHGMRTFADVKYDGYRVQVHKSGEGIKIFTRNKNELNYACYPDIMQIVERLPTCIIEAELVGPGSSHLENFANTKKRFRRPGIKEERVQQYLSSGVIDEVPLSLRIFDTIQFEKKDLLYVPLEERRQTTETFDERGIEPSETEIITSVEALEDLLTSTFKASQEGRVCKNPSSVYQPGKKNINWVKFKKSESLDLVVVGFYSNEKIGRDLPFSSVLCATYNHETGRYETLSKINATKNGIANEIYKQVSGAMISKRPKNVAFSEKLGRASYAKDLPDSFIDPSKSVVLEVNAMNINRADNWQTCGLENQKAYSIRIASAQQVRYDKSPKQATRTEDIANLYKLQEAA